MTAQKAVIGMSGGVDSSVAAYLLKKQGYDVIGITMQVWQDDADNLSDEGGCCGLSAANDARRIAERLDIPFYVLNFKRDFKKYVIDYFISEYLEGRTPNPCIACNKYVKWESLLNKAVALGADYIATGHYAKTAIYPKTGRYTLQIANSSTKDQTYALYSLSQEQLRHTLMPVGDYDKDEIREIARREGLITADKPDSQDICFVPDGDYGRFIEENTGIQGKAGNFVNLNGDILGRHKGIYNYTIGQRKGLGIAMGHPVYVCELRPDANEVVLTEKEGLLKNKVLIRDFNYMAIADLNGELRAEGKLRYSQKKSPCTIRKNGEYVEAVFDFPQRAATPGQSAVFYDDSYVLGGGVIV